MVLIQQKRPCCDRLRPSNRYKDNVDSTKLHLPVKNFRVCFRSLVQERSSVPLEGQESYRSPQLCNYYICRNMNRSRGWEEKYLNRKFGLICAEAENLG
jgi:hypothetical protein